MAQIGSLTVDLNAEVATFKKDLGKASANLRSNTAKMNKSLIKLDRSFKKSTSAVKSFSTALGLTAGVAAFAAAVRGVVRTGAEFESAISDLSAITGATGKDLEFLSEQARQMGRTTTLSAREAAEAFKLIASAKPDLLESGEALAAVTREAVTLAEAAGLDLPTAARALGNALNQFQADAEDASRFINVLAAGAKFGASEIDKTSLALKDAGTVAKSAGISFEELNAAIQLLAEIGVKGQQAGVGLRNVILKLQKGADDTNPAIVGLEKALDNLGKKNLSTAELMKLFGLESFVVGQRLIETAGRLGSFTEKLTGTNVALEQATIKFDNLKGDSLRLASAFADLQIQIEKTFDQELRGATGMLTNFINRLGSGIRRIGEFIDAFKALGSEGFDSTRLAEINRELAILNAKSGGDAFKLGITDQKRLNDLLTERKAIISDLRPDSVGRGDSGDAAASAERAAALSAQAEQQARVVKGVKEETKATKELAGALEEAAIALAKLSRGDSTTVVPVEGGEVKVVRGAGGPSPILSAIQQMNTALKETSTLSDAAAGGLGAYMDAIADAGAQMELLGRTVETVKAEIVEQASAISDAWSDAMLEAKSAVADFGVQALRSFDHLADGAISSLNRIMRKLRELLALQSQVDSGGGGGGSLGSGLIGVEKFRHGGRGTVGGVGGPDSQLIQFKASPREVVTVTPPGSGGGLGGGGGEAVSIINTFRVAPGADVEGFRRTLTQSNRRLVRQIRDAR